MRIVVITLTAALVVGCKHRTLLVLINRSDHKLDAVIEVDGRASLITSVGARDSTQLNVSTGSEV